MQRLIPLLAFLLLALPGDAATITALRAYSNEPGESEAVVLLELGPGEVASVFEGSFTLLGGSLRDIYDDVGFCFDFYPCRRFGADWPNAAAKLEVDRLRLSFTSNNRGGSRHLADFEILREPLDRVQLLLDPGWILKRDIPAFPYFEDLPLEVPEGGVLLTLEPIPEPSTLLLCLGGLVGFALGRTRGVLMTVVVALAVGGQPAQAVPITFGFEGIVSYLDDPDGHLGGTSAGAQISGYYTFESEANDRSPQPYAGTYDAIRALSIQVGEQGFAFEIGSERYISVVDDLHRMCAALSTHAFFSRMSTVFTSTKKWDATALG